MSHSSEPAKSLIHGVMAEYSEPEALIEGIQKIRGLGYKQMEAYTPFPVEGLTEALGRPKTKIQWVILTGAICGGTGAFLFQCWTLMSSYPLNLGGRPAFSWPAFMPVTFELTVLSAAFTAVIGMLVLNGLPQPYHPVFNVKEFDAASKDKFFLCVESGDPKFNVETLKSALKNAGAEAVYEVEE